jgi:transcriptional regulator with XRE-family HTH domain
MNRAKQIRIDRGLGIAAVAKDSGVHHETITKIEDGGDVQPASLVRLGSFYGVQPSSLYLPAQFEDERSAA